MNSPTVSTTLSAMRKARLLREAARRGVTQSDIIADILRSHIGASAPEGRVSRSAWVVDPDLVNAALAVARANGETLTGIIRAGIDGLQAGGNI